MPVQIQLPGYRNHESALDQIVKVAGAGAGIYSALKDSGLKSQQERALNLSNQQAEVANTQQQATMKAMADANSPESKYAKLGASAMLESFDSAGILKSTAAQKALGGMRDVLKDPTTSGLQAHQMVNSELSKSLTGMSEASYKMQGTSALSGVRGAQLEETKNQNAIHSGDIFEKDAIIKASKISNNSLNRAMSILDNPNKPLTTKDLNLAYNDYINSVTAGGAATEGKIHRELPESFSLLVNDLEQKFGVNADLRNNPKAMQLIDNLKENVKTVKNDMSVATSEQGRILHDQLMQSSNPKVREQAKAKLRQYAPDAYAEIYGGVAPKKTSENSGPGGAMSFEQFMKQKGG